MPYDRSRSSKVNLTMCVSVSGSHLLLLCFQRDAFPLAEPVKGLYARVNKYTFYLKENEESDKTQLPQCFCF